MNFREFVLTSGAAPESQFPSVGSHRFQNSSKPLAEADLLGKPSTTIQPTPLKITNTDSGPTKIDREPNQNGSGRAPGEMDDAMKRAVTLTGELVKLLSSLPHPWNKKFHAFQLPLRALAAKLQEVA